MRIGIDTGGTFTDVVLQTEVAVAIKKVPSRPDAPELAVLGGLSDLVPPGAAGTIVHGTTMATNVLVSRCGARTALITTSGFEDILEIGRQNRPELYNLFTRKPPPLVQRDLVFGLDERTLHTGQILKHVSEAALSELTNWVRAAGVDSAAVCLLFSYANPRNEKAVKEALSELDVSVSVSSEVLPAYREFERCSTTVVNAYVAPSITKYLSRLEAALRGWRVLVMQSNGGSISVSAACDRPVATILSGPAGGAIAAQKLASRIGEPNVISFDMGGTSTDVSLIAGGLQWSTETTISACPIAIPVIDVHTVGAGGGSIAYLDRGGALRVGPESAGADPGPACYGKADLPTVTDADLVLGRICPEWFLGGEFEIYKDRAEQAVQRLAAEMGISTRQAAEGIVRVANTTMQRALSVVSVQRGFDPRQFSIVAFGGAGPVHACDLCRAIGARAVIVPANPGLLSAVGMLLADMVRDYKKSILIPAAPQSLTELQSEFSVLQAQANDDLMAEGIAPDRISFQRRIEMRYVGQSYEIELPFSRGFLRTFDAAYRRKYGYLNPDKQKEIVNIRLIAIVPNEDEAIWEHAKPDSAKGNAILGHQPVIERGQKVEALLYQRDLLSPQDSFSGPAVLVEYSATTYLPSDFACNVDRFGNLVVRQMPR